MPALLLCVQTRTHSKTSSFSEPPILTRCSALEYTVLGDCEISFIICSLHSVIAVERISAASTLAFAALALRALEKFAQAATRV